MDEDERVDTDCGYVGDKSIKSPGPLYINEKYVWTRRRAAQRHETVNMQLNIFNYLNDKFRHSVTKHAICFQAIAILAQLVIENGKALFSVEYNDNCDVVHI